LPKEIRQGRRRVDHCHGVESLAVEPEHGPELRVADARRILQHCLEDRLQLARRTRDDLQHLRRCGLLLQRLAEVLRALAQLVEQAGILDGDDSLGGEGLQQRDLLVRERADLHAAYQNSSNWGRFTK
jgi:hypothetical protein